MQEVCFSVKTPKNKRNSVAINLNVSALKCSLVKVHDLWPRYHHQCCGPSLV